MKSNYELLKQMNAVKKLEATKQRVKSIINPPKPFDFPVNWNERSSGSFPEIPI